MIRSVLALLPATLLVLLAVGCGPGATPEVAAVAHLRACVDDAPAEPCPPSEQADVAFWTAEQEAQSEVYLDAAELCLRASLDGKKAGRDGACVDVYQAYVAEGVRSDLEGRLDETETRRGYANARIAVQRRRDQTFIEGMRANPGREFPKTIE